MGFLMLFTPNGLSWSLEDTHLMKTPSTPSDVPRPVDQPSIIIWYTCRARISRYSPFTPPSTRTNWVRKGVNSVEPAHLNVMPASDEDPEHTIRRAMNRRPTLHHNMVYVPGKNLQLRPFYRHELGVERCERSQTSPSQLDACVG
jgi:hypothetical protein